MGGGRSCVKQDNTVIHSKGGRGGEVQGSVCGDGEGRIEDGEGGME